MKITCWKLNVETTIENYLWKVPVETTCEKLPVLLLQELQFLLIT